MNALSMFPSMRHPGGWVDTPVHDALRVLVATVAPFETQLTPEKLQTKLWDAAWKAHKGLSYGEKPWKDLVVDYADKFFHSVWSSYGDRPWMEQVDFTALVSASIQTYFPTEVRSLDNDYATDVVGVTEAAFDYFRYQTYCGDIIKKNVMGGKLKTKQVWDALDTGRQEATKQGLSDIPSFVSYWVHAFVQALLKHNHPAHIFPERSAVALFDDLIVNGGGVPRRLVQLVGALPRAGTPEVADAVSAAYSSCGPRPSRPAGKGEKSGGYGPTGGKGRNDSFSGSLASAAGPMGGMPSSSGMGQMGGDSSLVPLMLAQQSMATQHAQQMHMAHMAEQQLLRQQYGCGSDLSSLLSTLAANAPATSIQGMGGLLGSSSGYSPY